MTVSWSYLHDVRPPFCGDLIMTNGRTALVGIPCWSCRRQRGRGQGYHCHVPPQLLCPRLHPYPSPPLWNWPVSWFPSVYFKARNSRGIPAFTTTTSTASTLELIPVTGPSFLSRTMFSSTRRHPCSPRLVVSLSPRGTTSVEPKTLLLVALLTTSPTPIR